MTLDELIKKHSLSFKRRIKEADKGTYGKLLIIAGSPGMAGAAYLSALSAFRCGIGMVRFFGPEENRVILQSLLPEAMYTSYRWDDIDEKDLGDGLQNKSPDNGNRIFFKETKSLLNCLKWAHYVVIGPGLSMSGPATSLIHSLFSDDILPVIKEKKLVVIDADGLNIIARDGLKIEKLNHGEGSNIVVTPHVVEMQRLLMLDLRDENPKKDLYTQSAAKYSVEKIKKNSDLISLRFSQKHSCITVLKDYVTNVASVGNVYTIDAGSGAMAKAGSGDVLTGFLIGVASILFGNTVDAVPLGVYLHGLAGTLASKEIGPHSLLASDIAMYAGKALKIISG